MSYKLWNILKGKRKLWNVCTAILFHLEPELQAISFRYKQ